MRVYGKFIDNTGKLNYGIHDIDEKGNVTFIKELESIPGNRYKQAENQEELLDEEAIQRFQVDVYETSLIIAVKDEEPILRYVDEGDTVNPHKVYYYGKDLESCFMCQDRALDCLEYIARLKTEYRDFAYNYVYRYLELRENPEADLDSLVADATSQIMINIQHDV